MTVTELEFIEELERRNKAIEFIESSPIEAFGILNKRLNWDGLAIKIMTIEEWAAKK